MTVWGMLAPKGWALVAWGVAVVVASVQFESTVTVGSLLVAALVVVLGGVFTLRNNLRSFWKDLAEERAEKIAALEEEAHDAHAAHLEAIQTAKSEMIEYAEEQRTIRHELKNEIVALKATLQVEQAKTDLSALMQQLSEQHTEAMNLIGQGLDKQSEIIGLLTTVTEDDTHAHGR